MSQALEQKDLDLAPAQKTAQEKTGLANKKLPSVGKLEEEDAKLKIAIGEANKEVVQLKKDNCRVVGATYANGWLIIVGASKTSPVPGTGMRRRHARRRILPSFRALRGDNTPTAALRGLRMITR